MTISKMYGTAVNQFHFSRIFKQYAQYPPSAHFGRKGREGKRITSESHREMRESESARDRLS